MVSQYPKLKVRRSGYDRKAFNIHRDGETIHIPSTYVGPSTFEVEDRGERGRTPEEDRWYKANGTLHGWSTRESDEARHKDVEETAKAEGWAKTFHKLQGLRNVTTSQTTRRDAEESMNWIRKEHREDLHESLARER